MLTERLPSIDKMPRKKKCNVFDNAHTNIFSIKSRLGNRFYSEKKFKPATKAYDEDVINLKFRNKIYSRHYYNPDALPKLINSDRSGNSSKDVKEEGNELSRSRDRKSLSPDFRDKTLEEDSFFNAKA